MLDLLVQIVHYSLGETLKSSYPCHEGGTRAAQADW